jgi:hypothetical protein
MMSDTISGDFVRLALTLIQQLPSSPSETRERVRSAHCAELTCDAADEAVLLRLQMVFGPMLMSALQLVDRREGELSSPPRITAEASSPRHFPN